MANVANISTPTRPSEIPKQEKVHGVLGFGLEVLQEGDTYIQRQPGHENIDKTIQIILGQDKKDRPSGLSQLYVNEIGRIARVLVSLLTDVKPFWDFRTHNKAYEQQAFMLSKLSESWFTGRMAIDQKWADVMRYYLVGGTGFAHQVWNPRRSDIDLIPEDPRDVLPFRPNGNYIQDAMGVIIRKSFPINHVISQWPQYANKIKADRDGGMDSGDNSKLNRMLKKINLGPIEMARQRRNIPANQQSGTFPVVDVFYLYLDDPAVNESSDEAELMGQFEEREGRQVALNNWSYVVKPGEALYPRKRMVIFTRTCVLYDGPSIYWHGQYPVTKVTLDPWPQTWLGTSPLHDLIPIQDSLNNALRARDDHIQKILRPNVWADNQTVSKAELRKFDTRKGGQKLHTSAFGKGINIEDIKPLDPVIAETIAYCHERLQTMSGVADMTNILKLNQMPSSDTVEAITNAMTPEVRGRSRQLEVAMRDFAMQAMYNFAQWYTFRRRYQILGKDGVSLEDWEFDPASFIPTYTDKDRDAHGDVLAERLNRPRPRLERADEFLRHFTFHIPPASMLKAAEVQEKLLYLQLSRQGYMDIQTTLEKLDIPNVGDLLQGSVIERLAQQAQMGLGQEVGPAGASAAGRKASGQEMPKMRGDGRISESG